MQWYESILTGLVQGITEFLPVSSSGHLWLVEQLILKQPVNMVLIVTLHLASLFAVVIFLRNKLSVLLQSLYKPNHDPFYNRRLAWQLMSATLITAGIGLMLKNLVQHQINQTIIIVSLLGTSLIVIVSSLVKTRTCQLSWPTIGLLGIVQGLAVLPGVSRSGVTIGLLLLTGLSRKQAVDISFLLSIPIISGSFLVFIPELISTEFILSPGTLLIGILVTFTATWLTMHLLSRSLDKIWLLSGVWCLLLAGGLIFI